jgi:uncharacterized protein with HEPN domain
MSSDLVNHKVGRAVHECELHLDRMHYAMHAMDHFMPLDEAAYVRLSMEQIQVVDQFVFRFSKIQDAMGERLFKAALELVGEEVKTRTFLDILNRLEQMGALESREQWMGLRVMRNRFAHEYDDDAVSMSEALNIAYVQAPRLMEIFNQIRGFVANYLDLSPIPSGQKPKTNNQKPK